jgi:DinB superfamily
MNHTSMIDAYVAGGPQLRKAIEGLSTEELNAFPVPGTWSIQQICVHLLHAEIFAVGRMCQIIAENVPLLMNWDENTFVARLRYETLPIDDVITCFETLRKTMGSTLRQQRDEDFARHGIHSKTGKVTLEEVIVKYTNHLHHHISYIVNKRQMLGKPVNL